MRRLGPALALACALAQTSARAQEDDGLVPWDPGTLAQILESRELTGKPLERARADAYAYHRKVSARRMELARTHRTALVETVIQDPDGGAGKPVAVLALAWFVRVATDRAHAKLLDGSGGPELLADLSELSLGRRRALLASMADNPHLYFFLGNLARTSSGALYLRVERFEDLGIVPERVDRETYAVLNSTSPIPIRASEHAATRARVAALRKDPRYPYVPLEALLKDAAPHAGRRIATLGIPNYDAAAPTGPAPVCPIRMSHFGIMVPELEVLLSKLGRSQRDEVFRGRSFGSGLAFRGFIRRAPNGALYLEAESVEFVGTASHVDGLLDPEMFDSKKYREERASARDSALRALRESEGRWPAPLAHLQDVAVSSSAYAGRPVRALGVAEGFFRGPDGWVAGFSYTSWKSAVFAVRLEGAPAARRAAIPGWKEPRGQILLVHGVVRDKDGLGYIDADDFIDAGPLPLGISSVDEVLEFSPRKLMPAPESARASMRADIAALKRDPARSYVLFEDLVLEPGRWVGKAVSVAGQPMDPELDSAVRRFSFTSKMLAGETLVVTMDRLPPAAQAGVLRLVER
ncbi:MAG: hypothetical protein HY553_06160, partial [Elusimicrobia bacterium]|nr:hypothetical protein [Elusimicrobiota bacterium]